MHSELNAKAGPAAIDQSHDALVNALDADPLDRALHLRMIEKMQAAGDKAAMLAHQIAVATLDEIAQRAGDLTQRALPLYNLATAFFMQGRLAQAHKWYVHALRIHPDLAIAHQNLAVVLRQEGLEEEADHHRSCAYRLQRVFVEPVREPRRNLLILCSGNAQGNVPFDTLLSSNTATRIQYAIDCAAPDEDALLPDFDLVFNAIGEPDLAQPLKGRIEQLTQHCGRALLNPPERVVMTQRHRTAELLAGIDGVVVPSCMRFEVAPADAAALADELAAKDIAFPVLMRPQGTHGGEGLQMHTQPGTLLSAMREMDAPCYVTQYHDFRHVDGHYRKYRMVFVDREPFAYHLAISSRWLVHYVSADMPAWRWKLDEEERFLADAPAALGARAMKSIIAIGRRLDMDYAGIDFSLLPDGRILVFEVNATMLVHREATDGVLAHKNRFVQRIVDAFEQMQVRRMNQ